MPWVKKFADKGWYAKRCYTSSPQCMPARFSWITGIKPSEMGITKNMNAKIKQNTPTIMHQLKEIGVETAIVGKTHWTSHTEPGDLRDDEDLIRSLGFDHIVEIAGPRGLRVKDCKITDEWKQYGVYEAHMEDMKRRYSNGRTKEAWTVRETILPEQLYPDIWIKNESIKMLETLTTKSRDWCLWVSFVGPHEPFDTPNKWKNKNRAKINPGNMARKEWIETQNVDSEIKKTWTRWKGLVTEKELIEIQEDYGDHIGLIDDQIGDIYQWLCNKNLQEDTAIIFTSDHGEMMGDGNMLYKGTMLESAIRVPFVYKPIKGDRKEIGFTHSKPIGLTKLLKKTIQVYRRSNSLERIREMCDKTRGVVVEFKEERAYIQDIYKIVMTNAGKILWATKTECDDSIEYTEDAKRGLGEWQKLVSWALRKNNRYEKNKNKKSRYIEIAN